MDAAVDFEREGPCLRRESLGLPEEKERGETKELERKSPTGRVCSANLRGGWRGVLEMAQEGLILAAQEQALKINSVIKHSIDKTSETPL